MAKRASRSLRGQLSGNSGEFDGQANNLTSTGKYYLRAFARNSEGIGYGLEKSFDTSGWLSKPAWTDSNNGGAQDRWTSPWFGNFFLSANGWAMHDKMGWVYPVKGKTAGVWFWKKGQGWLWTDSGSLSKVVRRLVQELGLFLRGVGRQKSSSFDTTKTNGSLRRRNEGKNFSYGEPRLLVHCVCLACLSSFRLRAGSENGSGCGHSCRSGSIRWSFGAPTINKSTMPR